MSDKSPVKPAAKVLKRAPWMKFYTADWRADPGLRMCSFAARGLWMDMLSVMHEAELYGHLLLAGRSPKPSDLSSLLGGGNSDVVAALIEELEINRVFSRTKKGVIFSRRMCTDAIKAAERTEHGLTYGAMGGNPEIRRGTVPKEERVRRFKRQDSPAKTDRIFMKCNGKCYWCGVALQRERPASDFFHCDHLIAICDGGGNDEENMVAACASCNHKRARSPLSAPNPTRHTDPNPSLTPTPTLRVQSPEARLQTSESKLASQQAASERESRIEAPSKTAEVVPIGRKPTMPAIHSPAHEWLHLVPFREVDQAGITRAYAGPERFGTYLDIAAERVMTAMGLKCGSRDWTPLIRWLDEGYDLHNQILPIIERRRERGHKAPGSLQWYDSEIRQEPAEWAKKAGRTFPATLTAAP